MKDLQANRSVHGFTLIELVVVIIILGILAVAAAPKFINLQSDALASTVKATGGAFKSAVNLAHAGWIAKGASGPLEDFPLYHDAPDRSGTIDINANGWPAQHYLGPQEPDPNLNNVEDCVSVWQILFAYGEPTVSRAGVDPDADYRASYISPAQCDYVLSEDPGYKIYYNANTGQVTTTIPN
ncbi:prepilin-type N-terminal cleavage/methylation domain-containing protein [Shewanella corallii]|uniref:Prepilin-type N-terminal cleavage/methylation domain-containing protein n=1 Tax=Shewanella corallii TaxID=560080 RepID=A0ABT0N605_9GAMM|nr:prepilin-type N-terminal cleavage/methylation domain-containing protein [Shewanella corallii]MCL2913815.1 prepilin-type N-terminal cleavage/methylation domain-containing protein [Shewanella corallii]